MFIPLLLLFTQFTSTPFYASNLGCWVTGDFYYSQPLVISAVIPQNVTDVKIIASAGRGSTPFYRLRECYYPACTTYTYYRANCRVIAELSFGENDLTNLLLPGQHHLTLDSLESSTSTEITSAVLNVTYPAFNISIDSNQTWSFLDSNTSRQTILSNIFILNPYNQTLIVPFDFGSDFELISGSRNGTIALPPVSNVTLNATFIAQVITSNYSFFNLTYNFSASFLEINATVENNFSIPFNFNTTIALPELNCEETVIPIINKSEFSIYCAPFVNHSFENWLAINSTLLATTLLIESPFNFSINASNFSVFISALFEKQVNAPDSFFYSAPLQLNLSSEFLSIFLNQSTVENSDIYNFSFVFFNPTNASLNFSTILNFSQYDELSLISENNFVYLNNSLVFVTTYNKTNFSLIATNFVEVPISFSSSPQFSSNSQPSIAPTSALPLIFVPSDKAVKEEITEVTMEVEANKTSENNNKTFVVMPLASYNTANSPALISGFSTAFPIEFAILPLFLISFFWLITRKKLVSRKTGDVTKIKVFNNGKEMKNLILQEILPKGTAVQGAEEKSDSVLGIVLTWKRAVLSAGEQWVVAYSSKVSGKGKLAFEQNGKKIEKRF